MCAVDNVTRYVEIWNQLRVIPVSKRPAILREELDAIWYGKMTEFNRIQLDRILEAM